MPTAHRLAHGLPPFCMPRHAPGSVMRVTVRPLADPRREIDLTHQLTAAIARELHALFGGNAEVDWLEAEWHLHALVRPAAQEAGLPEPNAGDGAPAPALRRRASPTHPRGGRKTRARRRGRPGVIAGG